MRGSTARQLSMLSAVTPDELIPTVHPIRRIRPMVELALDSLAPTFDAMYAAEGRPSIPPEHLLKGCLLMALYSIRSERQFCERLQYDLLFKWFLGLNVSDPACGGKSQRGPYSRSCGASHRGFESLSLRHRLSTAGYGAHSAR